MAACRPPRSATLARPRSPHASTLRRRTCSFTSPTSRGRRTSRPTSRISSGTSSSTAWAEVDAQAPSSPRRRARVWRPLGDGIWGAGRSLKVFLVGHGISYSRSPAMHNAAFRAMRMDWTYDLLDVAPEDLRDAVGRLRAQDVGGANVTIPYKQKVMDQLDTIAPDALRARAVNTIVNDRGRLGGYNTDIPAIRSAIAQVGVDPESVNAVILGAGGAARAAAAAAEGADLT